MEQQKFQANGKLLLFGEYLVLKGSKCFAFPLNYFQTLTVNYSPNSNLEWKSYSKGIGWFEAVFSPDLTLTSSSDDKTAHLIQRLLHQLYQQNNNLTFSHLSFSFDTNFNKEYGWGTSSTLIALLSKWANTNPYVLLENTFGGSGYDIAATQTEVPFIYTVKNKIIQSFYLPSSITNQLLFVYLGKKQNSASSVTSFNTLKIGKSICTEMDGIIDATLKCNSLSDWELLMNKSEQLLSPILKMKPVKQIYFSDYPYAIKSLGAWGGDFIMATFSSLLEAKEYFRNKGFNCFYTYKELAFQNNEKN